MCTSKAEDLIVEIVEEKVNADIMFTAFDISKEVQKALVSDNLPFERHTHLKGTIHREITSYTQTNVYQATLVDVGAATQAFLYHPQGEDPNNYVPQQRQVKTCHAQSGTTTPDPGTTQVLSISTTDDDDDGDGQDTGGRSCDQQGRLCVPAQVLRSAGFIPGEIAYITPSVKNVPNGIANDDLCIVSKRAPAGLSPLSTTYTVDTYNDVRIGISSLESCGFNSDDTFDFEKVDDQVYVTRHSS